MNIVGPSGSMGNIEKLHIGLEYGKREDTSFRNYIKALVFDIRYPCYIALDKLWA